MEEPLYKISFENNSFLWLPAKTCSTTISWILTHYNFSSYRFNKELNEYEVEFPFMFHLGHDLHFPQNHENMIFICTMRHPYHRVVSMYKMSKAKSFKPTKEEFQKEFHKILLEKNSHIFKSSNIFNERRPDYIIRTENILEDLIKIPFIKNSKLYQCGILEEMVEKKLNISFPLEIDDVLTQENKDEIYSLFQDQFEIGEYQR